MARLQLHGITRRFGTTEVLRGIDLDIGDGEFVVFVGPSGCGKSTLLRIIAGLDEPTSGELLLDDENALEMEPRERGVAMVFQNYALYPHMTVYENLAFGIESTRLDRDQADAAIREAATMLKITALLDRKPKDLSGGQRQRVAIGRALVRRPKLFLLDEPLSNLDTALRGQTRVELASLHERMKATTIYVTHDQVEAMTLADRIVVLDAGRVSQVGSPLDLYDTPANLFVAGFIGSLRMNLFEGECVRDGNGVAARLRDGARLTLGPEASVQDGEPLTIGMRPEHLHIDDNGPIHGEVMRIERLGDATLLHVGIAASEMMIVRLDGGAQVCRGDVLTIAPDCARVHLFGADGRRR